jgi:hypothetical protein
MGWGWARVGWRVAVDDRTGGHLYIVWFMVPGA